MSEYDAIACLNNASESCESSFDAFYLASIRDHIIEAPRDEMQDIVESLLALKKKKRKKYYVPVKLYPRILKSDIRRDYAKMMINSFNSESDAMMLNFVKIYSVPEFHMLRFAPYAVLTNIPKIEYVEGAANIVAIFRRQLTAFPDISISITQTVILPNLDKEEGSKVVFVMTVKFTQIYHSTCMNQSKTLLDHHQNRIHYYGHLPTTNRQDQKPQQWIIPDTTAANHLLSLADDPPTTAANHPTSSGIESIVDHIHQQKLLMEPCPDCQSFHLLQTSKPIAYVRSTRVTLYLDKYNQLYRMELSATTPPRRETSS